MFGTRCHHPANGLLPFHLNGSLEEGEDAEVRAHLAGCPICAAEVETLAGVAAVVRQAPFPILDGARSRRRPAPWLALPAAAALGALATGLVWMSAGSGVRRPAPVDDERAAAAVSAADTTGRDDARDDERRAEPAPMTPAAHLDLKGGPTRAQGEAPHLLLETGMDVVVLSLILPLRPGPEDRLALADPSGRTVALSGPLTVDSFGRATFVVPRPALATPGPYVLSLQRAHGVDPAEAPLHYPFIVDR